MAASKTGKASAKKKSFEVRRWRESKSKRRERAKEIVARLHGEYPDADCELNYSTPWELLVATILSAQSTDVRVNKETPALFARYPTIAAMAESSQEDMEEMVRRTGLLPQQGAGGSGSLRPPSSRNFGGEMPANMDDLLTLRGVARKTANVVLGTAFGIASGITVDTHVNRLSHRLDLSRQKAPEKIEQELDGLASARGVDFRGTLSHLARTARMRRP